MFVNQNLSSLLWLLPPATKLRQGNVFTPACQSFRSQGFCHTPRVDTHSWADTPRQTPLGKHPLWAVHAGIWSTSGQYASPGMHTCLVLQKFTKSSFSPKKHLHQFKSELKGSIYCWHIWSSRGSK